MSYVHTSIPVHCRVSGWAEALIQHVQEPALWPSGCEVQDAASPDPGLHENGRLDALDRQEKFTLHTSNKSSPLHIANTKTRYTTNWQQTTGPPTSNTSNYTLLTPISCTVAVDPPKVCSLYESSPTLTSLSLSQTGSPSPHMTQHSFSIATGDWLSLQLLQPWLWG